MSIAPFNFGGPVADTQRNGVASDSMQRWMMGVLDFMGGEYRAYTPTTDATGFSLVGFTYRLTGGDCQVNISFTFNSGGLGTTFQLSLPVPAINDFGPLTCYMNVVGSPIVPAVAVIQPGGTLHFYLANNATFPAGTVFTQVAGRYRVA